MTNFDGSDDGSESVLAAQINEGCSIHQVSIVREKQRGWKKEGSVQRVEEKGETGEEKGGERVQL